MYKSLFAVIIGGSFGCVLRWALALKFNGAFPSMPLGTLLVNLIGGLIIGCAMAFFIKMPDLDPAWRLLVTTGFCGGLTTFSTFSAEIVFMLQEGRFGWAAATVLTHVLGSLLMTFIGFGLVTALD
ncbi:fluoride efflux transporter CrcB [Pseudomonas sp. CBSPBW29]|uniref:fluoride efflux transporter CrcB n=1 Tax=Pseudomonas TaxID=286 RepID=UPI0007A440DB|nr:MULTISPECIES: fluoride efflux transporter CrcB [Pseudomonas]WEL43765.1 fluoride efflux transporter CrcB [Pseudomonas sp. CBSPBW29]WEL64838.1 fluoride efflux transporter CrcB [Pseudomonas sp. CBSPGW29]WEL68305.1 fluoride efflux transporter CrcB [Pseudomonas sp. CBSPCGW29]WEL75327.1 fluoride efflux transporter CrcB [Pseudomonas sp. CBSPAW29]WEL80432.1 fluoride efflux transporter CrcB [Pseudomonas sp. CBSPCAW29]WEL88946.1 fluoride efflux transporter CrcB [Pseudomonas sp. CBSPCBW29]